MQYKVDWEAIASLYGQIWAMQGMAVEF